MEELNLELNHTYLLRYGHSSTISSATILMITDKAYRIRWNNGLASNDTWELKNELKKRYTVVEDISDHMNNEKLNEILKIVNTEKQDCPDCNGSGWIVDDTITSGKRLCTRCWISTVKTVGHF